jgi:hypothetical protein
MAEQLTPRRGTNEQRRAWTTARRETWRERDAARFRLGSELARRARFTIPEEAGFLVVPPGAIAEAAAVVEAANDRIDSIGHERLVAEHNPKNDTMCRGFLPDDARDLASPYLRFALSQDVIAPVASYLGVVPILYNFDVWYSPPAVKGPRKAQLWHQDGDDTTQVKVWVHCHDIARESGPLTALSAARSEALADEVAYDSSVQYRLTDDKVSAFAGDDDLTRFDGPAGTVDFVDTSRCFHFGSRVGPDAPARRVFYAQYVTPYAFKLERDDHEDAPLRDLAAGAESELEQLILGAAPSAARH